MTIALLAIVCVVVVSALLWRENRSFKNRFVGRERLQSAQLALLYDEAFASVADVAKAHELASAAFQVEGALLRPDDTFDGTLAHERGFFLPDSTKYLFEDVEEAIGACTSDELAATRSMRDLVRLLARRRT